MGSFIAGVFATFVTLPLVGFFILYMLLRKLTKNKRKSVHIATYITTVFLILSVHYAAVEIFGHSLLWLIALVLLVVAMIMMFVHWKVKHDLEMKLIAKGFFRMNFVLFLIAHIVLNIGGIAFRISSL
jgi:hypothetical protein